MDTFISSVDRLLPNCSFCFTDYLKKKLELNYIINHDTFDDYSLSDFYFPDFFQIYKTDLCIKDEYIEFIDERLTYILLNLLNKEIFCIDKKMKDILLFFRGKQNIKTILSHNEYKVNTNYFLSLVYNGLLKKASESDSNYIDKNYLSKNNILNYIKEGELLQKISENGYSTSFLIKKSNKYFILKCLSTSDYYSQKEALLNEIHIRNKLDNPDFFPSIISYDLKSLFVVTEYIQGEDLNVYLINNRLSLANKIITIKQILKILSTLHINNIIHGDVHLGQFRITPDKDVKLLDLELAVDLSEKCKSTEAAGGSFEYLEPEAIVRDPFNFLILNNLNKKAEVYRIGVLIYYIIYNEFPFLELTWKQLFLAKTTQNPDFPTKTKIQEKIPYSIIKIMEKCLSSNPNDRYNSCDEIEIN